MVSKVGVPAHQAPTFLNAMGEKSKYYVNEQAVRLIAFVVVILTGVLLYTRLEWVGLFMAVDFFLRAFTTIKSPLAILAKVILDKIQVVPKPIFALPKRFAAALGFVFSTAITVLFHFGLFTAAYAVGGILIFCAVLESVFKVCLGCYVYNGVVAPVLLKSKREKQ